MQALKPHLKLNSKKHTLVFILCIVSAVVSSYVHEHKKSRVTSLLFTQKYKPFITASFNGHNHSFVIDTGASYHSILDDEITDKIENKTYFTNVQLIDFDKNHQELSEFYTEKVKFLGINVGKFFFLKASKDFFKNNHYSKEPLKSLNVSTCKENIFSYLGHQLLGRMGLCIDFKNKIFRLYKPGIVPLYDYPFGFFNLEPKLPLEYSFTLGPVCEFSTEFGKMKFLIDTGCPFSVIHPSKLNDYDLDSNSIILKNFKIQNKEFGPIDLHLEPKTPIDCVDGILGIDFLQNKEIFFNMSENYFCLRKKA
jgi:hypothetical protein